MRRGARTAGSGDPAMRAREPLRTRAAGLGTVDGHAFPPLSRPRLADSLWGARPLLSSSGARRAVERGDMTQLRFRVSGAVVIVSGSRLKGAWEWHDGGSSRS